MKIFTYGSNMCGGWLRHRRIWSTRFVTIAALPEHDLRFHKRSMDGSGKADAYWTGSTSDVVRGVVLEIDDKEKAKLDRAEGLRHGYSERSVEVQDESGTWHRAMAYVAQGNSIDTSLRPYSWYKRLVVDGAQSHGLPPHYMELLAAVETWEDPNPERAAKAQGLNC